MNSFKNHQKMEKSSSLGKLLLEVCFSIGVHTSVKGNSARKLLAQKNIQKVQKLTEIIKFLLKMPIRS